MNNHLTRRGFLKLSIIVGGACAASALIAAPSGAHAATHPLPTGSILTLEWRMLPMLIGTPTGIAARWPGRGDVWTIDGAGVVYRFEEHQAIWVVDAARSESAGGLAGQPETGTAKLRRVLQALDGSRAVFFPEGHVLYLARWRTLTPAHQALLVLPALHSVGASA